MNKAFYFKQKRELRRKKKESSIMFLVSAAISVSIFLLVSNFNVINASNKGLYFTLIYILINTSFCAIINLVELITLNK